MNELLEIGICQIITTPFSKKHTLFSLSGKPVLMVRIHSYYGYNYNLHNFVHYKYNLTGNC